VNLHQSRPPTGQPHPPRRRRALGALAVAALLGGALAAPAVGSAQAADEAPEQVANGDFSAGTAGWWGTANVPLAVVDGRLCVDVPGGTANPWDAIIGQNDIPLLAGESYTLTYTATATVPVSIHSNVQMAVDPWTADLSAVDRIEATATPVSHVFTARADNDAAQVEFQIGGSTQPFTFCVDDVSLRGGAEPPVYVPDTGSPVRVNQVGYLPKGPKSGTVVTESTSPLPWTLNAADGTVAATGTTTPGGVDPTSRQNVQTFDFSAVTAAGDGYTVTVDGSTSEPFSIASDIYNSLRTDSLAYFYHNRSGIPIDAALVGQQYARPAGHIGVAPNQGDTDVPCQPGGCDYRLDVSGGWYDAGDQGKYVVNGGISVAQLMATYERTLTAPRAGGSELADGKLRVPEHGNSIPDILDEARWELDFILKMQVPAGQALAGMVHHKVHDAQWTGLPTAPDKDPQPRELHPPSTAATLNLAATGAQCARLFARYDATFAARCLTAAETAWAAAKAHPDVLASPSDGTGGGTYSDDNVSDEFYWAAAELFTTTGKDVYRQAVLSSPLHGHADAVFPRSGMSWGATAGLGALTLATVPNQLTAAQLTEVRTMVTTAADGYAQDSRSQLYGLPYAPWNNDYAWGSNSQVLNDSAVLAVAHDLTGRAEYRDAVLHGMDYLLGRNPLNLSYITGYGERNSHNEHHRFWSHQLNPDLPNPPPGALAGGPNATAPGTGDPVAAEKLTGCAPAMCYIDDIGAWSTNEVAVNWNAALAFVASYVDDLGDGSGGQPAGTCEVAYSAQHWGTGFTTNVALRNTGTAPISPWTLTWSFADNQRITNVWSAAVTQSGHDVTAKPLSWNTTMAPGATVWFGFNGTASGPVPDPTAFSLNGGACRVR
jgi:endoglucanase